MILMFCETCNKNVFHKYKDRVYYCIECNTVNKEYKDITNG